jgi:pyruvate kinase
VADVTNAVTDGADAVMTSGETAKGKYPDNTIAFMNEIILNTEAYLRQEQQHALAGAFSSSPKSRHSAIAKAAVTASIEQNCQAILVLTNHGTLPPLVAAFRPQVPVFLFCKSAKMGRQLQLHRAIYPIVSQVSSVSYERMAPHAVEQATQLGLLKKGDSVVIVSIEGDAHATADMKIWTV